MPAFAAPHSASDGSPATQSSGEASSWYKDHLVETSISPFYVSVFVLLGVCLITFVYRRRVRATLTCLVMQALERANFPTLHIHFHAQDYTPIASSASEDEADLEIQTRELNNPPPPYIPNPRAASISRTQYAVAPLSITVPARQSATQMAATIHTPPTPMTSFSLSSVPSTPSLSESDVSSPRSETSSIQTPKSSPCGFTFDSPTSLHTPQYAAVNEAKATKEKGFRPAPLNNLPRQLPSEESTVTIPLSPTVTVSIHTTHSRTFKQAISSPPPNIVLTSVPRRQPPQTPSSPAHFLAVPSRHTPKRSVTAPVVSDRRLSAPQIKPQVKPFSIPPPPRRTAPPPRPLSPPRRSETSPMPRRSLPAPKPVLPDDFEAVYPELEETSTETMSFQTEKPKPRPSWSHKEEIFEYSEKKSAFGQFAPWNNELVEKENDEEEQSEPETPSSASIFFSKLLDKSKELKEKAIHRAHSQPEFHTQALPPPQSPPSGFFSFRNKLGALAAKAVSAIEKEFDSSDDEEHDRDDMHARMEERRKLARSMFNGGHVANPVKPVVQQPSRYVVEKLSMFVIGDEDD